MEIKTYMNDDENRLSVAFINVSPETKSKMLEAITKATEIAIDHEVLPDFVGKHPAVNDKPVEDEIKNQEQAATKAEQAKKEELFSGIDVKKEISNTLELITKKSLDENAILQATAFLQLMSYRIATRGKGKEKEVLQYLNEIKAIFKTSKGDVYTEENAFYHAIRITWNAITLLQKRYMAIMTEKMQPKAETPVASSEPAAKETKTE